MAAQQVIGELYSMPPRKPPESMTAPSTFERVPQEAPPNRLARLLGASDPKGAESAIVNCLAELGLDEVTPNHIQEVLERYGVRAGKRDHVVYTVFRSTVEAYVKRDLLTPEGERLLPQLAAALGIPSEEVDKVTSSVIRSRKNVRGKAQRRAAASIAGAPPEGAAPLLCPKCRSPQVAAGSKGYGLRKAAAGFLVAGPLGLFGGLIGSKKVIVSCLACGHRWMPGQS